MLKEWWGIPHPKGDANTSPMEVSVAAVCLESWETKHIFVF